MTAPFVVLGDYKPPKYRGSVIGKDLVAFTKARGLSPLVDDDIQRNAKPIWGSYDLHAEVRRSAKPGSEGTSWHQDGDTSTSNMDFAIVLWSNRRPTEFKVGNNIYRPKPFQIVIANNLSCYHRRNPKISGKRWSFRQRIALPVPFPLP